MFYQAVEKAPFSVMRSPLWFRDSAIRLILPFERSCRSISAVEHSFLPGSMAGMSAASALLRPSGLAAPGSRSAVMGSRRKGNAVLTAGAA
jgi:hypothetical protein